MRLLPLTRSVSHVAQSQICAKFGNVFVYPVTRPSKSESASTHNGVDHGPMFLVVTNGPEEAGWDLLEERVRHPALVCRVSPSETK